MVGSCLKAVHTDDEGFDVIRYDRAPGYDADNSRHALFVIYYYSETCHLRYPGDDGKEKQILEYAEPTFFDRLDAFIWNARSLDYIMTDLDAIIININRIKEGLLQNPIAITKRIGMIKRMLEKTSKWELTVRKVTKIFCNEDNQPASGTNPLEIDEL